MSDNTKGRPPIGEKFTARFENMPEGEFEIVHEWSDGDYVVIGYAGAINADPGNMMVLEFNKSENAWWLSGDLYGFYDHDDGWVLEPLNTNEED